VPISGDVLLYEMTINALAANGQGVVMELEPPW
jgi:hypothetical protein